MVPVDPTDFVTPREMEPNPAVPGDFFQVSLPNVDNPLHPLPLDPATLPYHPPSAAPISDGKLSSLHLTSTQHHHQHQHHLLLIQTTLLTNIDEIALYDRQIRLWGVQAQEKIRSANILLITIRALGNEIAKNLVLAGIHSLTIIDHATVAEADLGAQFFLSSSDVGSNRAVAAAPQIRKLNPRVGVFVDQQDVKLKKPDYFGKFDVVIATDVDPRSLNLINTATRVNHKPFYAAGTHGFYGFIFSDLIEHEYVVEREQSNRPTLKQMETRTRGVVDVKTKTENGKNIEMVKKREVYSTWFLASDVGTLPEEYLKSRRRLKAVTPILSCLRALWEFVQNNGGRMPVTVVPEDLKNFTLLATQKHKALGLPDETLRSEVLRKFLQNMDTEIAPVTAVLGGQLAQDVINVLGANQQVIQNMVVFDGDSMTASVYPLHPDGDLGEGLLPISEGLGNGTIVMA